MYREIEVNDFLPVLLEQLKFCESILDIGSGTGTLLERYEAAVVLGLEIHRPYLLHRQYKSPHIIPVHADASHMDKLFLPKTFSAVTFIDSIEHFNKNEAKTLLGMAERIANNRVVVFTLGAFFHRRVWIIIICRGALSKAPERMGAGGFYCTGV